MNISIGYNEAK